MTHKACKTSRLSFCNLEKELMPSNSGYLSISAIFASVKAFWEGLLWGGVLPGGAPCLGGKGAASQLLPILLQLLLRT